VLFRGDALVVAGRYRGAGKATVRVAGRRDGSPEAWEFSVDFPERERDHAFVPKLWATRRVAALLEDIRRNGEQRELVDEVTRLGKKFGLVTPYTSYLIKEEEKQLSQQPVDPRPDRRPLPPRHHRGPQLPHGDGRVGAKGAGGYAAAAPLADVAAFESTTGAGSVATSRSLGKMKAATSQADTDDASVVTTQAVGDRSFRLEAGEWVDGDAAGAGQTVKVKYLSALYFSILSELPELRSALALGERVQVRVGALLLVVGPDGASEEDDAILARLRSSIP
jgi:Ca-activated chloride channel family protein